MPLPRRGPSALTPHLPVLTKLLADRHRILTMQTPRPAASSRYTSSALQTADPNLSRTPMTASQLQSRPNNTHPQSHGARRQSQLRRMQSPDLCGSKPLRTRSTSLQNTIDDFPSGPSQSRRQQAHSRLCLGRRPTRPDTSIHSNAGRNRDLSSLSSSSPLP